MKRLVEFPLQDGGTIMVEVDSAQPAGVRVRGGSPTEIAEKARQSFETSLERIKPAAAAIIAKLRELSDQPEQVSVEFGIKLSAEAGVVLASTGVEANFKVTLQWKRAMQAQASSG
ncbi:MAG TPA: CU044_2847 family protein [Blastocatellia bacterium]|nr:CU044_2847 family protein [Blastocatellia bacterium]